MPETVVSCITRLLPGGGQESPLADLMVSDPTQLATKPGRPSDQSGRRHGRPDLVHQSERGPVQVPSAELAAPYTIAVTAARLAKLCDEHDFTGSAKTTGQKANSVRRRVYTTYLPPR